MANLIRFVRKHLIAVGIFTVSFAAVLWFAGGLLFNVIYFNDPKHQDQALKRWMSPQYVGLSYDIPRPIVVDALGVDPAFMRGKTLGQIAAAEGISLDELTTQVRNRVEEFRETGK